MAKRYSFTPTRSICTVFHNSTLRTTIDAPFPRPTTPSGDIAGQINASLIVPSNLGNLFRFFSSVSSSFFFDQALYAPTWKRTTDRTTRDQAEIDEAEKCSYTLTPRAKRAATIDVTPQPPASPMNSQAFRIGGFYHRVRTFYAMIFSNDTTTRR